MNQVVQALQDNGQLENIDTAAIDMLAVNLNIIYTASNLIETDGVISTNDKGQSVPHPAIKILNDAQRKAMEIMKDYGLTALARKKLNKGVTEQEEESPLMQFFNDGNS